MTTIIPGNRLEETLIESFKRANAARGIVISEDCEVRLIRGVFYPRISSAHGNDLRSKIREIHKNYTILEERELALSEILLGATLASEVAFVGDEALFIIGLFPERYERRGIAKDIARIGQYAYGQLAGDRKVVRKEVYQELADRFVDLAIAAYIAIRNAEEKNHPLYEVAVQHERMRDLAVANEYPTLQ